MSVINTSIPTTLHNTSPDAGLGRPSVAKQAKEVVHEILSGKADDKAIAAVLEKVFFPSVNGDDDRAILRGMKVVLKALDTLEGKSLDESAKNNLKSLCGFIKDNCVSACFVPLEIQAEKGDKLAERVLRVYAKVEALTSETKDKMESKSTSGARASINANPVKVLDPRVALNPYV